MYSVLSALIIAIALVWSTNATIKAWSEPIVEEWHTPRFCGET